MLEFRHCQRTEQRQVETVGQRDKKRNRPRLEDRPGKSSCCWLWSSLRVRLRRTVEVRARGTATGWPRGRELPGWWLASVCIAGARMGSGSRRPPARQENRPASWPGQGRFAVQAEQLAGRGAELAEATLVRSAAADRSVCRAWARLA